MTGSESTADGLGLWSVSAAAVLLYASPSRPPVPVPDSRIEDDAVMPEDDDPWFDDEEPDSDGLPPGTKQPFWNR